VLISLNFVESFFLFLGEVTFLFILVLLLEFGLFLLFFFILKYKTGNLIRTFDIPFHVIYNGHFGHTFHKETGLDS